MNHLGNILYKYWLNYKLANVSCYLSGIYDRKVKWKHSNFNKLLISCVRKIPETLLQEYTSMNSTEKIKLSMILYI